MELNLRLFCFPCVGLDQKNSAGGGGGFEVPNMMLLLISLEKSPICCCDQIPFCGYLSGILASDLGKFGV